MQEERQKKVVVMGGGTGSYTILSGLKYFPLDISAIVSMADDGGSTGVLRTELGALPPGDLRQAIEALSEHNPFLIKILRHRFEGDIGGKLSGQSLGNMIIAAAEQIAHKEGKDFDSAMEELHHLFQLKGRVIPITLDELTLKAESKTGEIFTGEHTINTDETLKSQGIKKVFYDEHPTAHLAAIQAIHEADMVVICPGNLYCSILPMLIIPGISQALISTKANVAMIANLMTKYGHTDNFSVFSYLQRYEEAVGEPFINTLIYNDREPREELVEKYQEEGPPVRFDESEFSSRPDLKLVGADLIESDRIPEISQTDLQVNKIHRTLIRHNPEKVASTIYRLLGV